MKEYNLGDSVFEVSCDDGFFGAAAIYMATVEEICERKDGFHYKLKRCYRNNTDIKEVAVDDIYKTVDSARNVILKKLEDRIKEIAKLEPLSDE